MQRRNLLVEQIAALVEAALARRRGLLNETLVDLIATQLGDGFEQVEQAPGVTVGQVDQEGRGITVHGNA